MASDPRPRIGFKPKQMRFLDALERTERYGWDIQEIVRRFVDAGITAAIERGDIKREDGEASAGQ